jgi:NTP pyrophosphatase (non-canonical NTP hydrolase)
MKNHTLRDIQKQVDDWITEIGHGYWTPHEMLARLVEEVGETARLINHLYSPKKKKDSEPDQQLSDELADILFAVICLANSHNIDLQEAFEKMMEKYSIRDKERYNSDNNN